MGRRSDSSVLPNAQLLKRSRKYQPAGNGAPSPLRAAEPVPRERDVVGAPLLVVPEGLGEVAPERKQDGGGHAGADHDGSGQTPARSPPLLFELRAGTAPIPRLARRRLSRRVPCPGPPYPGVGRRDQGVGRHRGGRRGSATASGVRSAVHSGRSPPSTPGIRHGLRMDSNRAGTVAMRDWPSMELHEVIRRRSMVRSFSADPVDRGVVDRIVLSALRSPTAGNCRRHGLGRARGPRGDRSVLRRHHGRLVARFAAVVSKACAAPR